jgi:hypothetical protein
VRGKFQNEKKNWMGGEEKKKVPKQKLRSGLRKGKKIK